MTVSKQKSRPSLLARLALAVVAMAAVAVTPQLSTLAHAAGKHAAPAAASAPADGAAEGVVNLNTATEDELQLLPGVGASKAAAIVAWRKKYGGFKRVEDLTKVKGFGHKTLKKLKPYLAVAGETTLKEKPGKRPKRDEDGEASRASLP